MYTLQGIITDRNTLKHEEISEAKVVSLPQGIVMIPFAGIWVEVKKLPHLPLTDRGVTVLPESIEDLCHRLSRNCKVVYVEAEFFGGEGSQACSLWEKGTMIGKPQLGLRAINTALQFLGVEKGTSPDEFEALDLGKFRKTEDWLSGDGA